MKTMYKETAKSEKKPIGLVLLWIVFIYAFYLLWGIAEILLEVKSPFYIKHIVLFVLTTAFVWRIIKKYITAYYYSANKNEFTVIRKIGRKEKLMFTIKYKNIEAVYNNEEKDRLQKYDIAKKYDITMAHQNGKQVYIIYKFNSKLNLASLKMSRAMLKHINDNMIDIQEEENI